MQKKPFFVVLILLGMLGMGGCGTIHNKMEHKAAEHGRKMMVEMPWSRASAGMAKAGAAFMKIMNHTMSDDRLVAAKADISKRVELHTHIMDDGVMRMRKVPFIELPKGKMVELKPGGLHIMFMKLHNPLKMGEKFPLTLVFEKAGPVELQVVVKGAAAGAMGGEHSGGHGMH